MQSMKKWVLTASSEQKTPIFLCSNITETLDLFFQNNHYSQLVLLADENSLQECLPIIDAQSDALLSVEIIEIASGESQKNIEVCFQIWETLHELQADRDTLIIALGGGVVTDIAGFIASTYHRGISYINIPTTLMAQVDASIANKTGVNWKNAKNQIGSFYSPDAIFIDPIFLQTLEYRELQSGMAEIYKHALISDVTWWNELKTIKIQTSEDVLMSWIERSIDLKTTIVHEDPFEKDRRKTLNFGHTIGHALEAYFQSTAEPLLHGEAIILGMCAEAYLSWKMKGLSQLELDEIQQSFKHHYPSLFQKKIPVTEVISYLAYDKKNKSGKLYFSLLNGLGSANYGQEVAESEVMESIAYLS